MWAPVRNNRPPVFAVVAQSGISIGSDFVTVLPFSALISTTRKAFAFFGSPTHASTVVSDAPQTWLASLFTQRALPVSMSSASTPPPLAETKTNFASGET